jgi:Flp pilus assembly protein TadG
MGYGRRGERRRGMMLTAELLFVLPILMLALLGVVEFYMMVNVRMDLLNASRAGARVAASGSYAAKAQTDDEVNKTVHAALGTGRLSKFSSVHVTWAQDVPPQQTAGQADWVQVEVSVPLKSVIPDVLGWAGFALGRKPMAAATLMKQE